MLYLMHYYHFCDYFVLNLLVFLMICLLDMQMWDDCEGETVNSF
jgi:hypothetical protein